MFLVDYATRKSINQMATGDWADEEALLEGNEDIIAYWRRAFDYAVKLRTGFNEHAAQLKREIARSKITKVK